MIPARPTHGQCCQTLQLSHWTIIPSLSAMKAWMSVSWGYSGWWHRMFGGWRGDLRILWQMHRVTEFSSELSSSEDTEGNLWSFCWFLPALVLLGLSAASIAKVSIGNKENADKVTLSRMTGRTFFPRKKVREWMGDGRGRVHTHSIFNKLWDLSEWVSVSA